MKNNKWPDDVRLKMIEKSEFYSGSECVYQYGYYDGYQKHMELNDGNIILAFESMTEHIKSIKESIQLNQKTKASALIAQNLVFDCFKNWFEHDLKRVNLI